VVLSSVVMTTPAAQASSPEQSYFAGVSAMYAGISSVEGTIATERPNVVGKSKSGAFLTVERDTLNDEYLGVGWYVIPSRFGDKRPHLIVFSGIAGKFQQCPGTCPFHSVASLKPGSRAPRGDVHYAVAHNDAKARWQISVNGRLIGFFKDSSWKTN